MKINDLYFGYMQFDPNTGRLTRHNLFGDYRVKRSVARWITLGRRRGMLSSDLLHFCFFETWGRAEYEFVIEPWVGKGGSQKVDIWTMYVLPNRALLENMVKSVSVSSARAWLKEQKRK